MGADLKRGGEEEGAQRFSQPHAEERRITPCCQRSSHIPWDAIGHLCIRLDTDARRDKEWGRNFSSILISGPVDSQDGPVAEVT